MTKQSIQENQNLKKTKTMQIKVVVPSITERSTPDAALHNGQNIAKNRGNFQD